MLHDLLLAVTGHGGDVFVEKESRFEIANDLGFFHPSEIAIIHQLLNIGCHYKKVKIFCDTYDTVQIKKDADYRGGLYLSSLAVALRKTIEEYHSAVVELELKLMNDPQLPLSQLLLALQPLAPLVAAVSTLVTEIESKKVRGCMILEVLHKHTANSVAYIKEVLMRVEQAVHSVLYDQLTHWLLYGQLLDPHNELFIHTSSAEASDKADQTPDVEGLVDVLESQYWQLIEEIGKARDYQHLASTHHNFLVSITAQCFLNNQMVSNALQRLLKLIHNFCTIMETTWSGDSKRIPRLDATTSSEQSSITDKSSQMKELSEAFERAAAQLFLILSNLKLHQGSQYTSQLIMRIDYNKFCSKSATVRRFTSPLEVE